MTSKHSRKGIENRIRSQSASNAPQSTNKPESKKFRKGLLWVAGATGAAVISILVTGVMPAMLGQVANGAKIEDHIHAGPDIVVSQSSYYPDGANIIRPFVVPGTYRPSGQVVKALAQKEAPMNTVLMKQIHRANSVAIQDAFTKIILKGNRNEPILILNIHPVNLRRTRPLNGVLFDIPEAQGEFGNIQVAFDLDQISPHALAVVKNDNITNQPFFESNTISLANGEHVVLVIQAHTYCYSATFDLAVNYMVGDTTRTMVITNHGQPFRVSSFRVTKAGQLSYKQDFELGGNFSVTPLTPQEAFPADLFSGCPYFAASGGG